MLSTDICREVFGWMKQDEPKLLRVSKAAHELGLHPFTVRKWIKQGKIHAVWVGQEARVPRSEIERLVGKSDGRLLILYGRVSGQGQKEELETQLARLQAWAKAQRPGKTPLVLSDIGSGLIASRKPLQRLLKLVIEDQVAEIAVTSADRLTRFGQEYLQMLFDSFGVSYTVLEPGEDKTQDAELTADLLAILASISSRLYGRCSHKQKELLKCAQAVITKP